MNDDRSVEEVAAVIRAGIYLAMLIVVTRTVKELLPEIRKALEHAL